MLFPAEVLRRAKSQKEKKFPEAKTQKANPALYPCQTQTQDTSVGFPLDRRVRRSFRKSPPMLVMTVMPNKPQSTSQPTPPRRTVDRLCTALSHLVPFLRWFWHTSPGNHNSDLVLELLTSNQTSDVPLFPSLRSDGPDQHRWECSVRLSEFLARILDSGLLEQPSETRVPSCRPMHSRYS